MNHTREMAKNLILDLILAYLAQIWVPKTFLPVLLLLVVAILGFTSDEHVHE